MPVNVTVDHPELGDQEIYIHGLGTFKNGTTTEVDDEQVGRYMAMHSVVDHEFDDEGHLTYKPRLGPHPADQKIYGVKVSRVGDTPPKSDDEKEEN